MKNVLPLTFNNQSNDFSSNQLTLPLVSSSKIESRNQKNTSLLNSQSFNRSIDTMIISNKLTRTLKSTLEGLDLIPNYDESNYENNNIDIFKKRKTYLQQQKDLQNSILNNNLEDINKFTLNIINNENWGLNNTDNIKSKKVSKRPVKPDIKELEREVGVKVVKSKMPRSRKSYSMLKI